MARLGHQSAAILGVLLMISCLFVPLASASGQTDVDGDGIVDGLDDCPNSFGNSTIDRQGCPDHDGDGTSDLNDPVVMSNGGYLQDAFVPSSEDMAAVLFMPGNGTFYLQAMNDPGQGWNGQDSTIVRVMDSSTRNTVRTVSLSNDVLTADIAWSPDGERFAIHTSGQEIRVYNTYSGSLDFTVDTDGEVAGEIEFSPDGTMIVAVGYQDGNNGNGQVQIFNSTTGAEIADFSPGSSDYFYAVDFSPDGEFLLIGGYNNFYIYYANNQTLFRTVTPNFSYINAVSWSPDGNMVSICEGWGGSNARARVYHALNGSQIFSYTTSTSCLDTAWSPDSSQIAFSHSYYQADGASINIFDARTGTKLDTLTAPRPGSCNSGNNNNCGTINGIDWHPEGNYIISAHSRNDEGIYHWIVDPDIDGDGVLNPDDAFPEDGTQWDDTDGDGYGDNPSGNDPDGCINTQGTSTQDMFGCVDTDSDGWSDAGDDYPTDYYQWADEDGDGYPDNTADSRNPPAYGAVDYLPQNPTQWNDSDGDGYGDNYYNPNHGSAYNTRPSSWPGQLITTMTPIQIADVDIFPLDPEHWSDDDEDWVGDQPFSSNSDGCLGVPGNSIWDRLGCPDSDGDGWSDATSDFPASPTGIADAFPNEASQWLDADGDGYGDNSSGFQPDKCGQYGTSLWASVYNSTTEVMDDLEHFGCPDRDGDTYADSFDAFPDDPTQWADRDGDGCGENMNGTNPDLFINDGVQCVDSDGDGYGDVPSGDNGDWYPSDPTQWRDTDSDGYGDNLDGTDADICPLEYGTLTDPNVRGCPDSDNDGTADIEDPFPEDGFAWTDIDNDGYPDQIGPNMDDCPNFPGTSTENGILGCPDADGDGFADSIDSFPNDNLQWEDNDLDGFGDNYGFTNFTATVNNTHGNTSIQVLHREQYGDAFPNDSSQWSDLDGDGYGDNQSGTNPDAFPTIPSQFIDIDKDGYGDNTTKDAFEADDCKSQPGTSWKDRLGCLDSDGDGTSDLSDSCPFDPEEFEFGAICAITEVSDEESQQEGTNFVQIATLGIVGIVALLLAAILMAMISRQAAKRRYVGEQKRLQAQEEAFSEEDDRRAAWAEYYAQQGDFEKAKELGWVEKPQWQIHQEKEAAEALASIPSLEDL